MLVVGEKEQTCMKYFAIRISPKQEGQPTCRLSFGKEPPTNPRPPTLHTRHRADLASPTITRVLQILHTLDVYKVPWNSWARADRIGLTTE